MTITVQVLLSGTQVLAPQTTQYTVPASTKVIIDKCTATNTTGAAATLSINLVPAAGAAGAANLVLSAKSLAAGETYTCPEVVGHVLNAADFVSTLSGTANAISLRMSGRAVT